MARGTADSSLVKPAYSKVEYTTSSIKEFKACCDKKTGPLYFMKNYMRIQHPTRGSISFVPYNYQLDLINNYNNNRLSINMLGRQMGKTTVAAGYLLWYAMFIPDSTVLVASNKGKSAAEIMQRVRYAYENIPDYIRAGVTSYNKNSIEFDNGSRIIAETTTETTGRGMSISLVYLDEFAFVPTRISKEFWTSLSPTLATGGKCIITSTPNSDDDTFSAIWKQANNLYDEFGNEREIGANGFKAFIATWEQHPDRDDAWAAQERSSIGEERFLREHFCIQGNAKIKIRHKKTGEISQTTMAQLEEIFHKFGTGPERGDSSELLKNSEYEIWTDWGWSKFDGLLIRGHRETVTVELEDGCKIDCTQDHKIYTEAMVSIEAQMLTPQHNVITQHGVARVKSVNKSKQQNVYDIYNVKNNSRFYANGILVSNCQFVIYDETLINSLKLIELNGIEPRYSIGQVRWYKRPTPGCMYAIALDPSAGTGGDHAAIQVLELPSMIQVAEWQHNRTPIEGQMKVLMDIMQYIKDQGAQEIYWTVENNTIGEAALVVIRDTGEENFPGEFINEPQRIAGKRNRKGFHTSHKTKVEACISLKRLVESDKLRINSKPLVRELKNFVARGNSYSAKPGEHDDLVMSMIIVLRMIGYISTFDDSVYSVVNNSLGFDEFSSNNEYDEPMPIL
jgi:hypothetical protein